MKKLKIFLTKGMEEKYIKFYKKFILQTKTLNDSRVVSNRELLIFIFKDSMARLIS